MRLLPKKIINRFYRRWSSFFQSAELKRNHGDSQNDVGNRRSVLVHCAYASSNSSSHLVPSNRAIGVVVPYINTYEGQKCYFFWKKLS